ncbi:MAG: hypothetical protein KDI13_06045 [Alphaproteobacteria bacterium]|nr:hypothetical protein [Alphaproteobacteria bacterium]
MPDMKRKDVPMPDDDKILPLKPTLHDDAWDDEDEDTTSPTGGCGCGTCR